MQIASRASTAADSTNQKLVNGNLLTGISPLKTTNYSSIFINLFKSDQSSMFLCFHSSWFLKGVDECSSQRTELPQYYL